MWISRADLHFALGVALLCGVTGFANLPAYSAEAALSFSSAPFRGASAPAAGFSAPSSGIRDMSIGRDTNERAGSRSNRSATGAKFGLDILSRSASLFRSLLKSPVNTEFLETSRKADEGSLLAKWKLGRMYERGKVTKKNNAKAYKLFREVAQKHKASDRYSAQNRVTIEALVDVANLLREGVPQAGIKKDPSRAHQLLKYVASMFGHARAQFYLGQMNINGEGTKLRVKQGMRWLNLAARKKNAAAQAALGQYYLGKPKTGKPDRARGLMWLSLAQENEKNDQTRQQISKLYESMLTETSSSERERAGHLATSWKRRYHKVAIE